DISADHRVLAVDLPGHGFTRLGARLRSGLNAMAADLAALLKAEGFAPDLIAGHSAGAALAFRLALDGAAPRHGVVAINPALDDFPGLAGWLFPMMAKMLALNPLTAVAFSGLSSGSGARKLIEGTGSRIDEAGMAQYRALIGDRAHVDGALQMMSQWSLRRLRREVPRLEVPARFIVAERDATVPPRVGEEAAALIPGATVDRWADLGHLAHEEAPGRFAAAIRAATAASAAPEAAAAPCPAGADP
ncbi:MAG: alpha/beta fold hydrolase BchO, partial [Pseudomonadota bacterium]